MHHLNRTAGLRVGYLMQNGAAELSEVSGPQLHVLGVVDGLRNLGHSVRAVAFQNDRLGWSEDLQRWLPPEYGITNKKLLRTIESVIRRIQYEFKLPYLGLFDSLRYADACTTHLIGFDILYERHGYMGYGGYIASRWLGIPLILELNGNIIKEIDERGLAITRLQQRIGQWITIHTFRAADRVVVVSEALRRILIEEYRIPEEKVTVVINGTNLRLFSKKYDQDLIRSQYRFTRGPVVAFVGTFEPWHGIDLLISSFRAVLSKHPDAQLVLIGDGSGKDKAVAQASNYGLANKIRFLGRLPQDQVAAVLNVAKVLVAPYSFKHSNIVGTPLKLLEYMATGNGIVASTAPIHEIIEHGITGLRVPPANEDALTHGILCLLENDALCRSLGQNAALRAQTYSWDNVTRQLETIFVGEIAKKTKLPRDRKHIRIS
jgi:glycosyltransferase involved in cell wall biosynthesis